MCGNDVQYWVWMRDFIMKSKTDWKRLQNMSEKDIEKAAKSDPDAQIVSDKDLKKFKRVNPTPEIDVRKIRNKLHLSQEKFGIYFGVSRRTIQEWEQKRFHRNNTLFGTHYLVSLGMG